MAPRPPIDRWRFDALWAGPEKLWGLEAIARALGVSVSTVRRWAQRREVPIYRPDGRKYFALRAELLAWVRSK